ncbi:hypothetical protein DY000_02039534 [Brassica cretica]|uniref:Retrotransposon gag domain-containing protein n=1 Tax=Brassica cretica TaxID=69181 RepID=A0ABQ7BFP8_BRACR|nr:hypothetical protein DY000_02039534 [Brassica cretica]
MPILLRRGQSVSRERAVDGTNGMSIDGEPLPSIDGTYMPISTRSSKEELLFFSDPTRLELSIRKEKCTSSINTTSSTSIDTTSTTSIDTCDRETIESQKIDGQGTAILEPSAATEDAKVPLQRMLADLIIPSQFYTNRSAIRPLEIQGFQINPTHFSHVGQHPYRGLPDENPSDHIETLEDFFSGIQKDEATKDYIICKLFKYSLSGNAKKWLRCLSP